MSAKRRRSTATNRRRGFQALELLFVMPVLAVMLLAAVQGGRTMMIRSGITQAAILAAREAAKGADATEVAKAVNCVLAVHGIAITGKPGSGTKLTVQDGCKPLAQCGDPTMSVVPAATIRHDEILVTVWIKPDARRANGRRLFAPACDVLGLVSGGKQLSASSLTKKQQAGCPSAGDRPTTKTRSVVLASREATTRGE